MLRNVPRIRDTETQISLLERLGVKVEWTADNELRLRADALGGVEVDEEAASADPGLVPARRPAAGALRRGADAAARAATSSAAAASIRTSTRSATSAPRSAASAGSRSRRRPDGLKPCGIFMDEPSVMGTENALLAAALTPGPTTIGNAACEPHVQDLARLLDKMGARDRRDRLERDDRPRPRPARRRRARRSAPTTSRSRASWRSPPRPAASCACATPSPRTWSRSGASSAASGCSRWSRAATCSSRPSSGSRSATTSATRSRRSTTGRGRRSPPT